MYQQKDGIDSIYKNRVGFHLSVPPDWDDAFLAPSDYITFVDQIYQGLDKRPVMGVGIFASVTDKSIIGLSDIAKYLGTVKQIEGSVCVDRYGYDLETNIQTIGSFKSIVRCSFSIDKKTKNTEGLRYGLDHCILAGHDVSSLTAYITFNYDDFEEIEKAFALLQEYGVSSVVISLSGQSNIIENYEHLLRHQNTVFKQILILKERAAGYGIGYVAYEDHFNIFRDRRDDCDILFYTLKSGIMLSLSADGHLIIIGGRRPYDAGIWNPRKYNALDLVLSVFKENEDVIGDCLIIDQKPRIPELSIKTRSSVMASAIMAGTRDNNDCFIDNFSARVK